MRVLPAKCTKWCATTPPSLTRPSSTTATSATTTSGSRRLEKSYLLRVDGKVVERTLLMRVAVGIHPTTSTGNGKPTTRSPNAVFTHVPRPRCSTPARLPQPPVASWCRCRATASRRIYDTSQCAPHLSRRAASACPSNKRVGHGFVHQGHQRHPNGIIPMLCSTTARYVD